MVAPAMTNSSSDLAAPSSSLWTWSEQKRFETALCLWTEHNHGEFEPNWEGFFFPGKSPMECKLYFDMLLRDVESIEAGRALLPDYAASSGEEAAVASSASDPPPPPAAAETPKSRGSAGRCKDSQQERRKGSAWTEEEHRQFLRGLEIYGKGDWRSISRHFVVSRTPTQVASHAQKYFIRLNSMKKDSKRRNSIHDITTATPPGPPAPPTSPTLSAAPPAGSPPLGILHSAGYAGYHHADFYFYQSRNSPMPMHPF